MLISILDFNELSIHKNHQSKDRLNNSPLKSMQDHQMMKYLHIKIEHDIDPRHTCVTKPSKFLKNTSNTKTVKICQNCQIHFKPFPSLFSTQELVETLLNSQIR